jgi:predicted PurR-regulated permease PerM
MTAEETPPEHGPAPGAGREPPASRRFFALLLAIAAVGTCALFFPLAAELLFAAVTAVTMAPLYERVTLRLRGRRELSAIVITVLFALGILVPTLIAIASAIADLVGVAQSFAARLEAEGLEGILAGLPAALREQILDFEIDLSAFQQRLGSITARIIAVTGMFLKATGEALLSLIVFLIALVVFLADGPRMLRWLDDVVPLERRQTKELFEDFQKIARSLIFGNFGTSLVQSLVAAVGYLIARAPSPLIMTMLTFVLSFVPAIGGAGAGLFVAGVLLLLGKPWWALFLAVWALAIVGIVDNITRPIFVKRGVRLHGALVFFAILAGIYAFGASGLLLGPIIVTFTLALVRMYARDFKKS